MAEYKGKLLKGLFAQAKNVILSAGANIEDAINYSTSEHIIGEWHDGRVLYEKTIECEALPNATTKRVAHGISNLKDIVDIRGVFTNGTYWFPLNNPNPTSLNGQVQLYSSSADIIINTATDLSNFNRSWVTLRYTKTA